MKIQRLCAPVLIILGVTLGGAQAQLNYTTAHPLAQAVTTPVSACGQFRELPTPIIAWGGDMATVYANGNAEKTAPGSHFQKKGLSVRLYRQDRFVKQVEDYLACKTPFLRGTVGMLAMASDVLNADPRTRPVVIYQLTWSEGGDALVVKDGIREPKDLDGKSVAVQAYGPHVDYLTTVLKSAGVPLSRVNIKWVRDLIEEDKGSVHPARALREDSGVHAAFVISPDANALTSGGKVGTGAEDSVKGARTLLSTKTANRVIADVYVVRRDWFEANQAQALSFVHALMLSQQDAARLIAEKSKQKKAYDEFVTASAKLLLGSAQATADAEGMWSDANFVGWKGNIQFLTDSKHPRNLSRITAEVGEAFVGLKLITKPVSLSPALFDYAKLSEGISDTSGVEAPRFDKEAVDRLLRERQQTDRLSEGQLFSFEIRFKPNQNSFPVELYGGEFDRVVDLMSTYAGALLTIEGHADTLGYLKRKQDSTATAEELSRMRQGARNLTLTRSQAVRDALLSYAKGKGISFDPTQFATVGHGFMKPNVTGCTYDKEGDITAKCAPQSQEQWDAMRRVVFRVVSVEAEAETFQALK